MENILVDTPLLFCGSLAINFFISVTGGLYQLMEVVIATLRQLFINI